MTHFDYLLNAFEAASQSDNPAKEGYSEKRRSLFAYVREIEELRLDAERYRWLRSCNCPWPGVFKQEGADDYGWLPICDRDLDEAIDAALAAEREE